MAQPAPLPFPPRASTPPTIHPLAFDQTPSAELLARLDPERPEQARAALAELYARHAAGLRQTLRRLLGEEAGAEDLLHELFLALARHGGSFRGTDVDGWLATLAVNRVRDELRIRTRRRRRERESARDEALMPATEDPELEAALATLLPTHRAALELRVTRGLPHAEVARLLGVSVRTAKTWTARGLERLRELLEDRA